MGSRPVICDVGLIVPTEPSPLTTCITVVLSIAHGERVTIELTFVARISLGNKSRTLKTV